MNISSVTSITNAALNEQLLQQSGLVQPSTPVPSTGSISPVSNGTAAAKTAATPASPLTATPSKEPYSPQLRNYAAGLQVMQASNSASAAISSAIDPGSTATLADRVDLLNKGISLADHYAKNRRYFWGSVAFTYLMFVAYGVYVLGPGVLSPTYLSPAAQLVMMAALILTPNRRVHAVLVPVIFLLFSYNHLLTPMFSDRPWVAGPSALP
jgi:hypothetical protein